MNQSTISGIHLENITVGGNLTISGVTITNITQMVERPRLWVNVPALPNHFLGRDALVDLWAGHSFSKSSPSTKPSGIQSWRAIGLRAAHRETSEVAALTTDQPMTPRPPLQDYRRLPKSCHTPGDFGSRRTND